MEKGASSLCCSQATKRGEECFYQVDEIKGDDEGAFLVPSFPKNYDPTKDVQDPLIHRIIEKINSPINREEEEFLLHSKVDENLIQ